MNILQEIIDESKQILKDVINKVSFNNSSNMADAFLDINSVLSLNCLTHKQIIEIYKEAIPKIDDLFAKSFYRKNRYYKSSVRKRTIVTYFGELQFERNYYVDKNKTNGFFFIDKLFNFEQYVTYDRFTRAILIDNSINNNANNTSDKSQLLLNNLLEYVQEDLKPIVPRQTIYNWLYEWYVPKVMYKIIETTSDCLFVMLDEKYIHEQIRKILLEENEKNKKHFIMSKCFVTFTGAITKNNRTTLKNKHVFLTASDKPWKEFIDEIYGIYDFEKFKKIFVLSDSGTWILAGVNELKLFPQNEIILNTCEFHVKQYINRLTRNEDKRKELIKAIYEDKDSKAFEKLADEIILNSPNKETKEKYKTYILKHWRAILNMKDREIGSSMEAHISHCVASEFGSRPKGYSRTRLQILLKLQEYKLNGINIMDLYLKSYDKNEDSGYVYDKEEISYAIFEKNNSVLPAKYSGNPISCILNNIAYN